MMTSEYARETQKVMLSHVVDMIQLSVETKGSRQKILAYKNSLLAAECAIMAAYCAIEAENAEAEIARKENTRKWMDWPRS